LEASQEEIETLVETYEGVTCKRHARDNHPRGRGFDDGRARDATTTKMGDV
jgi:hypothetical protein